MKEIGQRRARSAHRCAAPQDAPCASGSSQSLAPTAEEAGRLCCTFRQCPRLPPALCIGAWIAKSRWQRRGAAAACPSRARKLAPAPAEAQASLALPPARRPSRSPPRSRARSLHSPSTPSRSACRRLRHLAAPRIPSRRGSIGSPGPLPRRPPRAAGRATGCSRRRRMTWHRQSSLRNDA